MDKQNALETLGLNSDASLREIKFAYETLSKLHRPNEDPEGFQRINIAYETLRDQSLQMEQKSGCSENECNALEQKSWLERDLDGAINMPDTPKFILNALKKFRAEKFSGGAQQALAFQSFCWHWIQGHSDLPVGSLEVFSRFFGWDFHTPQNQPWLSQADYEVFKNRIGRDIQESEIKSEMDIASAISSSEDREGYSRYFVPISQIVIVAIVIVSILGFFVWYRNLVEPPPRYQPYASTRSMVTPDELLEDAIVNKNYLPLDLAMDNSPEIFRQAPIPLGFLAVQVGDLKLLDLFLEKEIPFEYVTQDGDTPLTFALQIGRLDMALLMVSYGLDPFENFGTDQSAWTWCQDHCPTWGYWLLEEHVYTTISPRKIEI